MLKHSMKKYLSNVALRYYRNHESLLFIFVFLFFLFGLIKPPCAWCIQNIHFGSLEVHPFFSFAEGYVDNVYLAPKGYEKSSAYRSFTPGLRCDWNKLKYRIKLGYTFQSFKYDQRGVEDKNLYDLDSVFNFKFGKSGHGLDLDGGYRYRKTSDPYTSEDRTEVHKDTIASFGFRINMRDRIGIGINSSMDQLRYVEGSTALRRNRDIVKISPKIIIKPFTKTGILLEYQYSSNEYRDRIYAESPDSETHSALTGFEWEATEKLSGAIKAGYQWRDYDDPNGTVTRSPETWKVEVDLKQTFSEFTSLKLNLERRIEDTDYQYGGQTAQYFYSNQVELSLDHQLTYKVGTWIDLSYTLSDYHNTPREDQIWQFDLGFDYQFLDWIWGHFDYNARIRESNTIFDYQSSQFNLGLNLVF